MFTTSVKKSSTSLPEGTLIENKKASWEGEITHKYTAGIALKGHEVKAVREGSVNFSGAYVIINDNNTASLLNLFIGKYSKYGYDLSEQEAKRTRTLLLKKDEILKLKKDLQEKGKTCIPLTILLQHNLVKLELGVVKGRKKIDKKNLEKDRQIKRDMDREVKSMGM